MDPDKMVDYNHGSAPAGRDVPILAILALVVAVGALAFAVGLWWAPGVDARLDRLGERLGKLEQRDAQVRECLARNLLPPAMRMMTVHTNPALAREAMNTGLDTETLEWVSLSRPAPWHFGVDRRGLKPTGQTGAIGEELKPEK